ncbi:uncharacterized protein LOC120344327 isoform X6 [Styela clava]
MLISIVVIVLVYNIEETNGKQVVHCGDVGFLQYGDIIASREPPYTVGTVLEFACDRGFKGKGKRRISCLKSGHWSDPVPYCAPNSCQRDLTRVDERRKCRRSCITNQNCRGGFKQCLCDDWCGKTCFNPDADCAVPKIPENGYIIKNKISYGNTITYGCNEGFTLAGPITRRCQSDRRWSGNEPKCAAFSSCGHSTFETHSKIFGKVLLGTDAENGEWPWQVLLFHKNKNLVRKFYDKTSGFGGGSIINGQWILSAAHVFDPLPYRNPEKYFLIAAGMTKYPTEDQDIPDQINFYEAEKIRKHQDYDSSTFDYDIAMIRVGKRLKREGNIFVHDIDEIDGSITFSQYIRPVCLPCMKGDMLQNVDIWKNFDKRLCNFKSRSSMPYGFSAGEKAIVTGFGEKRDSDAEHHYRPSSLQRGELEILGDNKCVDAIRKIQVEDSDARYTNRMICAVSANKTLNVDACKGDSGGPLVKQLGKSSDYTQWLQIGVVSWGWKCGNEYPGFYTSVPKLMPWIWKTLDDSKNKIVLDYCLSSPCKNNGDCQNKKDGFSCSCVSGYRGNRCEININDCLPNPCQNEGKCVDRVNDYLCSCVDGFKGKRCEIEINNCRPNPCGNRGVCATKPGGYSCYCVIGFRGTRCESNINDCLPNPCQNKGKCVDRVNDFSCSCVDGFKGKRCEIEINNCRPNPCGNEGVCTTKPGGYSCFCPNGFEGTRCESIINDCSPNPCMNGGLCKDKINDFLCTCADGYRGKKCQTDINDCLPNPCLNGGNCVDRVNEFSCSCVGGFKGKRCEIKINNCDPNPCRNGGLCTTKPGGYLCFCPNGFRGTRCESNINDCLPNPCHHGGKCHDKVNDFFCSCLEGYKGKKCETSKNYCQSSPCKNEGRCRNLPRGFECFCRAGFSGNTCEIGRYCSQNPCSNGGKCYEAVDGFTCKCPSDFMGRKCEVDAECPPLENPKNGYVVVGKVTYGSVVKYVCNDGYTLVGLDERVCTSSRKWSGLEPTCVDFSECGVTGPLDPNLHNQLATRRVKRVVGGDDAPDNAWPWQASILVAAVESGNINVIDTLKRWELTIAGTIINKQWILTVTHPTEHMPLENFYRHQVIVVGVSSRSFVKNTIKTTVQMFRISKYILHEEFNKLTFQNDIALIKLGKRLFPKSTVPFVNIKEITFNAAVRPVCLPCTQKCVTNSHIGYNFKRGWDKDKKCEAEGEFLVKPGIKIVLTGFGTNETDYNIHTFPDRLQQVVLEVGDKNSCQRGIDDISFIRRVDSFDVFNSTFCTGSSIPHKVMAGCIGDGGAPVVRKITQRDGSVCWVQVGISSFGAQCDGKIPEFYTKVANHINWVQETMLKN